MYILVLIRPKLNKLGLGFPMSAVRHGFVFLSGGSGERRRGCAEDGSNICGGFPDFAGGNCISERYENSPNLVYRWLLWIWSGLSFVPPSSSPVMLLAGLASPASNLGGVFTDSM